MLLTTVTFPLTGDSTSSKTFIPAKKSESFPISQIVSLSLKFIQSCIFSVNIHKLLMSSLLQNLPFIHHEYPICNSDSRKSLGHKNKHFISCDFYELVKYFRFSFRIHMTGR